MAKAKKPKRKKQAKKAKPAATFTAAGDAGDILPPPAKMGRPRKLEDTPETRRQIMVLAGMHMTKREAAAALLVHPDTFGDFLRANPECDLAWEEGLYYGRASLRRRQWKSSNGTSAPAVRMQIWLGKQYLDQREKFDGRLAGGDGGPIRHKAEPMTVEELAEQYAASING